MSKFGELIDLNVPVLIDFYADWDELSISMHEVLRDVAAAIGDRAKVIRIDAEKNPDLAQALRVTTLPTLMIYKDREMVWRQSGAQDANTLMGIIGEYTS